MFKKLDILDEKDKRLRMISKDATFPLSDKEKIVYGYDMDNAIEDKQNIIDTHYKESAD